MSLPKSVGWGLALIVACITMLVLMRLERIPQNFAYVSEEQGGISVIDLHTFAVVDRVHPKDVAPRGLSLTFDGKYLLTANKNTSDASLFDTRRLHTIIRRIPVGKNPEFVKIHPSGKWMFTSFEPSSKVGPPAEGRKDDEGRGPPSQIVAFDVQDWSRQQTFPAGSETEGLEFSSDGQLLIVANEAQDTLGVYSVKTGQHLRDVELASIGSRPRGVKRSPQGNGYAVTLEGSGTLVFLDPNFNVIRSVATAALPCGVAFDRGGKRILVAAAGARKLQIFAADSLQQLGETSIGQRCWHFTFTPDDSKILMVCGRSNNLYVIDAKSYQTIRILGGFQMPWGIVTYPRAYGSLDLP